MLDRRWRWKLRFYYGSYAQWPKVPGTLAIETVHATDSSKDIEIEAGCSRKEIGRIDVIQLQP
jgi:hypothetical protein